VYKSANPGGVLASSFLTAWSCFSLLGYESPASSSRFGAGRFRRWVLSALLYSSWRFVPFGAAFFLALAGYCSRPKAWYGECAGAAVSRSCYRSCLLVTSNAAGSTLLSRCRAATYVVRYAGTTALAACFSDLSTVAKY